MATSFLCLYKMAEISARTFGQTREGKANFFFLFFLHVMHSINGADVGGTLCGRSLDLSAHNTVGVYHWVEQR